MKTIQLHFVMILLFLGTVRGMSQSQEVISAATPPPALPEYVQPACPTDGYMWIPGYWGYDTVDGYYWIPGYWVSPPNFGLLWTPPYWEYANDGIYYFHSGYWARNIGYYGGINYGFGYYGNGFVGGYWRDNNFYYNTAVLNINLRLNLRTYNDASGILVRHNGFSFNGRGGVIAQPRPEELKVMQQQRFKLTEDQLDHHNYVRENKAQFPRYNGGSPAATSLEQVRMKPMDNQGRPVDNFVFPSREANPVKRESFGRGNTMPKQPSGGRRR